MGLGGEESAIPALIQLSRDKESDVRDWATFGLGLLFNHSVDREDIRSAMVDRLTDQDEDTRGEALAGLVQYLDSRAIPALLEELSHPEGHSTHSSYRAEYIGFVMAARAKLGPEWTPVLEELDRQGMVGE
jgi:hypothetical protein